MTSRTEKPVLAVPVESLASSVDMSVSQESLALVVSDEALSSLQFEVDSLRGRLKRRNLVIDAIRKAYLRDVVTIKHHLIRSKEDPAYDPGSDSELVHRLPSLDMRPTLELFAPAECSLKVKPCEQCGGALEIIHRESKRVAALSKSCAELQKVEQECRLKASRMEIQANKDRKALSELAERSSADREVFLRQITSLKGELAAVDYESFEKIRKSLLENQKELAANRAKMAGYNLLKEKLDCLVKEAEDLKAKVEANAIEMKELERLRILADEEKEAALKEVEEQNMLLQQEREERAKLEESSRNISEELQRAHEKNERMQQLLDESRKNEAYLKQKISAADLEHADTMESEQAQQEELRNQVESIRSELRAAKKNAEKAKKNLDELKADAEKAKKLAQDEEGKRLTLEFEENLKKMQTEYENVISNLRKDIVLKDDKISKGESKLRAEINLRLEAEERFKAEIEDLKSEKEQLTSQVEETETKLSDAKDEITEVTNKLAGVSTELDAAKKELVDTKEELKESVNELEEARNGMNAMKSALANAEDEVGNLQGSLKESREVRVNSLASNLALKASLQKKRDDDDDDSNNNSKEEEEGAEEKKAGEEGANAEVMEEVRDLKNKVTKLEEELAAEVALKEEIENVGKEEKEMHSFANEKCEKLERQVTQLTDEVSKQQLAIDMFEEEKNKRIASSDDPEAARKSQEEFDARQRMVQETIQKSLDQRDEAHSAELEVMRNKLKEQEAEHNEKLEEYKKNLEQAFDGGDTNTTSDENERPSESNQALEAQIEELLGEQQQLQEQAKALVAERNELAKALEQAQEISSSEKAENGGNAAVSVMMKVQITKLKQDNASLLEDKNDLDLKFKSQREEMTAELEKLKAANSDLKIEVENLQTEAVQKNVTSAIPGMLLQKKLKDKEAALKKDAEQIGFLQGQCDRTAELMLGMCSNLCDYITSAEENLTKDAVDFDDTSVPAESSAVSSLANAINVGDVSVVELAAWTKDANDKKLIIDYLDLRYRNTVEVTRREFKGLRDLRDNPPKKKGGNVKVDFMAKQREFKLNKKLGDAEAKLERIREESVNVKTELLSQIEEVTERLDRTDRELRRTLQLNEQYLPQVKAWESLKVEHEGLQVKYNELTSRSEELAKDLERKSNEIKIFSTDLFKCNIKIKNYSRDMEALEKKLGSRVIEVKTLKKDLKKVNAKLDDIKKEEQDRLDSMEDMETQFSPIQVDSACQTDFIGKGVTLRQSNSMVGPSKIWTKPFVSIVETHTSAARAALTGGLLPSLGPETTDSIDSGSASFRVKSAGGILGGGRRNINYF